MKYLLFILFLVAVLITAGCVGGNKTTVVTPTQTTMATTFVPTITTIITEAPQPISTIPLAPVQTIRATTSDDIKTHFMDLAFGVESSTIRKNIPYVISTVTASNGDKKFIENFILEFNDLSRSGQINENLKEGEMADLRIKFIPQDGMKSISNYDKMFKSNDIITAEIFGNTIYINNNLIGDQRNHTILRSLYYFLGVNGETLTYPDSLFYGADNSNTKLTPIDKKALEILYGSGVHNGMNVDDVKKVIYLK